MKMSKTIIQEIQDDDPSFDPLGLALKKTPFVSRKLWDAATDRVYFDGYYGPINPEEWKEQDGRKPYSVKEALKIIIRVLDNVERYYVNDGEYEGYVDAGDIKAALVAPWYKEIYGQRYPQ